MTNLPPDSETHAEGVLGANRRSSPNPETFSIELSREPAASPGDPAVVHVASFGERFEVLGSLGSGGRGVVYRARDRVLQDEVALKTVLVHSPSMVASLRREFRVVRAVHHPNLVSPWDLFADDHGCFFTMPLITGAEPLSAFVLAGDTDAALRVARLQSVLPGVLGGLLALHARGIAHGDIKPANVLVQNQDARWVDFGLARTLHDASRLAAGTPPYMAPDVFEHGVTIASDMFSLAVMLHECLVGERPFEGSPLTQFEAKTAGHFPRLHELGAYPEGWSELLAQMLHPNPTARPTLPEVAERLQVVPTPATVRRTPPFRGRSEELAVLRAEHERARTAARCTLVQGPSGVGKSALLRAFTEELTGPVIAAACDPRESVPYDGLSALIDTYVEHLLLHLGPNDTIDAADIAAASELFPSLRQLAQRSATPPLGGDPEERRGRAILALRRLLTVPAGARVPVFLIDDFQWASRDTQDLVSTLLRESSAGVHWVLSVRTADTDATAQVTVPTTAELSLTPLPAADVQQLLADAGHSDTEPMPLPLLVLDPHSTARLHDTVRVQLDTLSADRRRLLELAAVARAPLPRAALLGAARLKVAQRALLVELEDEGWLTSNDAQADLLAPVHARVAEAVEGQLHPSALVGTHRALLDALVASKAEPGRLFAHALGAGEAALAGGFAYAAGVRADESLAFPEAAAWYARARSHAGPDLDRLALAEAEARATTLAGRRGDAAQVLVEAADLASTRGEASREHVLRAEAASQLVRSGALVPGSSLFERAFAAVGRPFPSNPQRWLLQGVKDRLATLFFWRPPAVIRDQAEDPAINTELAVLGRASQAYGITEPARGDTLNLLLLRLARRHGVRAPLVRAYCQEASTLAALGPPFLVRRAAAMTEVARELAAGDSVLMGHVHGALTSSLWSQGAWAESLAEATRGAELLRSVVGDVRFEQAVIETFRVSDLWWLGRYTALAEGQHVGLAEARVLNDELLKRLWSHGEPAGIALVQDDPDGAIAAATSATDLWDNEVVSTSRYRAVHGLVRALLYAGRPEEAAALLEREWPGLERALFVSLTVTGTILWLSRAKTALACAARLPAPADRTAHLKLAQAGAKAIRKRKASRASGALADLLEASILSLRGEADSAVARLREAAAGLEAVDMLGLAHSARAADPDTATAAAGRQWLADAGVRNPARFAAVYTPGFLPLP